MSAEIQRLISLPSSPAQIDLINTKINNLKTIINNMQFTDEQIEQLKANETDTVTTIILGIINNSLNLDSIISKLTGGRDGTASKLMKI